MTEQPWLFAELERAAAEYREMPVELRPVVVEC